MTQPDRYAQPGHTARFPRRQEASGGVQLFWAAILLTSIGFLGYRSMGPGRAMGVGSDGTVKVTPATPTALPAVLPSATPAGVIGKKPTLALFTADWCGPCREFKSKVLSDPQVQSTISSSYSFVKVDLTQRGGPGAAEAQRRNVRSIPTLLILDQEGREVSRREGGLSRSEFMRWANQTRSLIP